MQAQPFATSDFQDRERGLPIFAGLNEFEQRLANWITRKILSSNGIAVPFKPGVRLGIKEDFSLLRLLFHTTLRSD